MDIQSIINIAYEAGNKILEVYRSGDFGTDYKSDNSPLTLADKASHLVIVNNLKNITNDPILSEEGKHTEYEERKNWDTFWLIDPLDGTKEFVKKGNDFTVNIALIRDKYPVFGLIYAPVMDTMYYGQKGLGAFKIKGKGESDRIRVRTADKDNLTAVMSKSHATEEDRQMIEKYQIKNMVQIGSSLKFCLVAEGVADFYYRHGPTMEWDTAAGQAILESAGGSVTDEFGKVFQYNKKSLLNGSFLCKNF